MKTWIIAFAAVGLWSLPATSQQGETLTNSTSYREICQHVGSSARKITS